MVPKRLILAVVDLGNGSAVAGGTALARDGWARHGGGHEFRGGHEGSSHHGRFEAIHRPSTGSIIPIRTIRTHTMVLRTDPPPYYLTPR